MDLWQRHSAYERELHGGKFDFAFIVNQLNRKSGLIYVD